MIPPGSSASLTGVAIPSTASSVIPKMIRMSKAATTTTTSPPTGYKLEMPSTASPAIGPDIPSTFPPMGTSSPSDPRFTEDATATRWVACVSIRTITEPPTKPTCGIEWEAIFTASPKTILPDTMWHYRRTVESSRSGLRTIAAADSTRDTSECTDGTRKMPSGIKWEETSMAMPALWRGIPSPLLPMGSPWRWGRPTTGTVPCGSIDGATRPTIGLPWVKGSWADPKAAMRDTPWRCRPRVRPWPLAPFIAKARRVMFACTDMLGTMMGSGTKPEETLTAKRRRINRGSPSTSPRTATRWPSVQATTMATATIPDT
mmetsp:Transcript_21955/g.37677  ORF Transcript_21955/g.37677 Transcript_21955/m.37677 type:complete len:317 (-) Transcript_21955:289-1239(-)